MASNALGPIASLLGVSAAGANALAGGLSKGKQGKQEKEESAIDIKMAQKARRTAQDKINAIIQNRELSRKAMTRRIGGVLDEYKGGKK